MRDPAAVEGHLRRVRLFGLDFISCPSTTPIVDELIALEPERPVGPDLPIVVTPNTDQVVHLDRGTDDTAAALIRRARYVLPDGQPIVWASRLLRTPLAARLPGSTLVAALWPRLVANGAPALVVASSAEIARRVEHDQAAAIVAPRLSLTDRPQVDSFVDQLTELVRRTRPTHVFVTLGFPKQCNLIDGVVNRLIENDDPVPVFLAVGASFEMYYGLVRRAPLWMQRAGLEWLYRFLQEPRRLFRRYFIDDPWFVAIVWREHRRRSPRT